MAEESKRPVGRPLYSREEVGYEKDLDALARLRKACLRDKRIKPNQYIKISEAVQVIEHELLRLKSRTLGEAKDS